MMTVADDLQILPAVAAVDDPIAPPIIPGVGSAFVNTSVWLLGRLVGIHIRIRSLNVWLILVQMMGIPYLLLKSRKVKLFSQNRRRRVCSSLARARKVAAIIRQISQFCDICACRFYVYLRESVHNHRDTKFRKLNSFLPPLWFGVLVKAALDKCWATRTGKRHVCSEIFFQEI